jgi:hypothetical protein
LSTVATFTALLDHEGVTVRMEPSDSVAVAVYVVEEPARTESAPLMTRLATAGAGGELGPTGFGLSPHAVTSAAIIRTRPSLRVCILQSIEPTPMPVTAWAGVALFRGGMTGSVPDETSARGETDTRRRRQADGLSDPAALDVSSL